MASNRTSSAEGTGDRSCVTADETTSLLTSNSHAVASKADLGREVWILFRSALPSKDERPIARLPRVLATKCSAARDYCNYRATSVSLSNFWLYAGILRLAQGPLQLSIAASGFMIATCTAWLLAVGGTTALVVVLWCSIGPILAFCGQSDELAYGTQSFLRCLSPFGLGYVYFETLKKYLQCQMFQHLIPFVRLVIYGLLMVGAEWWAFELIAIAAGALGDQEIAAQSILMTVDSILALVPFGLGVASTNRVGSLLGQRQLQQARTATRASSLLATAYGSLSMITLISLRGPIAGFFTNDRKVIMLAVSVFPWGAAFQIFDSLQAANSGCLRALGRADIGATFNLIAYYAIAIPVGLTTGFWLNWGLHGLWLGLTIALACVGLGEFSLLNFVPWAGFTQCRESHVSGQEEESRRTL
ncbi:hypothetical protein J7T55_000741 [Diaporthe amygdali]|uniref:uncharacterized protein n=1 Tax=Phomopsis amygdali TaxID=1214568 RepID=UPI0022FF2D79|nr:uncharacterized protein J7T55_000741 [Diaporthe amygdali]KAJ0110308.1 hypothetical protein J7T55_000741 [Diaporthe amygdali]